MFLIDYVYLSFLRRISQGFINDQNIPVDLINMGDKRGTHNIHIVHTFFFVIVPFHTPAFFDKMQTYLPNSPPLHSNPASSIVNYLSTTQSSNCVIFNMTFFLIKSILIKYSSVAVAVAESVACFYKLYYLTVLYRVVL